MKSGPANNACVPSFESRLRPSFPGRFRYKKGETYKRSPVIRFEIEESGKVSKPEVKRSSGVRDIDNWVLDQVKTWKFKPNPGCGIIEDETTFVIDFELGPVEPSEMTVPPKKDR